MNTENGMKELRMSGAQKEVREEKEKVAEEPGNVPDGKRTEYIIEKTKGIRAEPEAVKKAKEQQQDV